MDKQYYKLLRRIFRKSRNMRKEYYKMRRYFDVTGYDDGQRKIAQIANGYNRFYVMVDATGALIGSLAAQGGPITKEEVADVCSSIRYLDEFEPRNFAHLPGLYSWGFTLPGGEQILPPGGSGATISFHTSPERVAARGTHEEWCTNVAELVKDQDLGVMGLASVCAPPLKRYFPQVGPVILEIVGRKGSGKSTLQQIVASGIGPASPTARPRYQTPCEMFVASGSAVMAMHADMLTVVEDVDMAFAGESAAAQMKRVKALLFQSSAYGEGPPPGFIVPVNAELFALSSSVKSLAAMTGEASNLSLAGAERLITLPVGWDSPYGVFSSVPEGYADAGQFAAALTRAVTEYHGTFLRHFLNELVKAIAADEKAVARRIEKLRRTFLSKASVDGNDGIEVRLAEVFALIYVSGALAKHYGALPQSFNIGRSVLACYRMARAGMVQRLPFQKRLEDLAEDAATVNLDDKAQLLSPAQRLMTRAYVRERAGRRELLVPATYVEHVFPDWGLLFARDDVKATMIRDGDHATSKRRLGPGQEGVRCFCFKLLPQQPATAEDALPQIAAEAVKGSLDRKPHPSRKGTKKKARTAGAPLAKGGLKARREARLKARRGES